MRQVRIHGRGGQGVVTASEMMSVAAFRAGHFAMSFPSFGSERMGAPVAAFVRVDNREIELREPVLDPDFVIVQDSTLLAVMDVLSGLVPEGYVLINSRRALAELPIAERAALLPAGHAITIPATELALQHIKLPKPNTVMLGAACALYTDLFTRDALEQTIRQFFSGKIGELNVAAAKAGYDAACRRLAEPAETVPG